TTRFRSKYSLKLDGDTGDDLDIQEKSVQNPDKTVKDKEKKANKAEKAKGKENKSHKKENKKENDKTQQAEQKNTVISEQDARKIALKEFSGTIDDIELDEEDGRLIYEIEIEKGEREAEIEIDAHTGEIIVIEID